MPNSFDAIVIGCGTMGAAACLDLTTSHSATVLGLDRFTPPHTQGEHHGSVRMFRMSYYEHPAYVPWLRKSLNAWKALGDASGASLLELTGALYLGDPSSELISGSLCSAREHSLPHEVLDSRQIIDRFPMFRIPATHTGILERDAGFIRCELAVQTMLDLARATSRLTLRTNEHCLSWSASDKGVEVRTTHGTYRAQSLIITAGPWSGELLSESGIRLTVTRQPQGWIVPANPAPLQPHRFPCWAIGLADNSLFYGFPALADNELKLAHHTRGTEISPNAPRAPTPDDSLNLLRLAGEYFPELGNRPIRTSICAYTNSLDSHYIIDRHPQHPNVAFGCGFSGHGFKMAPAVGSMLATLAMSKAPHPEPFFSLERLRPA